MDRDKWGYYGMEDEYEFGLDDHGVPLDPVFGEPGVGPQSDEHGDPMFDDEVPW